LGLVGWADTDFPITAQSSIPGMGINNGTVQAPGLTPLGYTIAPDGAKVFYLFAQPVQQTVSTLSDIAQFSYVIPSLFWVDDSGLSNPGAILNTTLNAWGYNGQSPGPVIEVQQGDTVRIMFSNELPEATTLHLHGITHAWEDDGLGGVSEAPLAPLTKRVYQWTVTQCGTFLYHSGYQIWKQSIRGLFGMLVSHCPGIEPAADKDFAIVASSYNIIPDHDSRNCPAWWQTLNEWYLFNGHASPSIPLLTVSNGDVVRIRFINAFSPMPFSISIRGHQWTLISNGDHPLDPALRTTSSTVSLAAGLAQDVLFTARTGIWALNSHTAQQLVNFFDTNSQDPTQRVFPGGMYTLLCVGGVTPRNNTIICPSSTLN